MSVNKVILVGNAGKDPVVRYFDKGVAKATFPLATSETYTNQQGETITTTEWHNIVLWRSLAEVAEKTVEAFMDTVKHSMVSGNNVYLRGFGSFIVKKRAKKTARNISKNTTIIIPAHNIPAFKPAKTFITKVKSHVKK